MNIFIICGYGIPDSIKKDINYVTYLNVAFNLMFEISKNQEALIIPCGGPTAMTEPLDRTEAQAMASYIKTLMARPEMKEQAKNWRLELEDSSLSTLENLVFAKKIISDTQGDIHIFCEATRDNRIKTLTSKIFDSRNSQVHSIDFDITKNRYLEQELINKKEEDETKNALWALESDGNMKAFHDFFVNKFEFLRDQEKQGVAHVDAVEKWFKIAKDKRNMLRGDSAL